MSRWQPVDKIIAGQVIAGFQSGMTQTQETTQSAATFKVNGSGLRNTAT
jgi:hypothetical protein